MDSRTALLNAPPMLRRSAALALLGLVVLTIAGTGFAIRASLEAGEAALRERKMHLGRLELLLATLPNPATDETVAALDLGGPEFLRGDSEALLQAAIQNRLKEIAAASGVEVLAVGNTPIVERDDTRFAGLRASVTGSNDALVDTIFAIETTEPYLTIRSARLDKTGIDRADGDGPQELLLQVEFDGALPPTEDMSPEAIR